MNASSQDALDDLCSARDTDREERFRHRLEAEWSYPNEGYRAVFAEACRLGIQIVALDGRDKVQPAPSGGLDALYEEIYRRDEFMSDTLGRLLTAHPGARALVWTGALHSIVSHEAPYVRPTQPELLRRKFGIASRSFVVQEGNPAFKPKRFLKEKDWPRPSSAYFRAVYMLSGDPRRKVMIYTDRDTIGWDGVILWDKDLEQNLIY